MRSKCRRILNNSQQGDSLIIEEVTAIRPSKDELKEPKWASPIISNTKRKLVAEELDDDNENGANPWKKPKASSPDVS